MTNVEHVYNLVIRYLETRDEEEVVEIYGHDGCLLAISNAKSMLFLDESGNRVYLNSKQEQEYFFKLLIENNNLKIMSPGYYIIENKYSLCIQNGNSNFYQFIIRKYNTKDYILDNLLEKGMFTIEVYNFFKLLMESKSNIFITGPYDFGKITLQNCLLKCVNSDKMLETNFSSINVYGKNKRVLSGEIFDKLDVILQMSPSYINYGELAMDDYVDFYYECVSSGNSGIVCYHMFDSRSSFEGLKMILSKYKPYILDEEICKLMNYVITTSKSNDGSKKIISITEVYYENNEVIYNEIYTLKVNHSLEKVGSISKETIRHFEVNGIDKFRYKFLL